MPNGRITVRVPEALESKLRGQARLKGRPESELVREALETYLGQESDSRPAYELAEQSGLIGCIRKAPKDLSTNPKHFEGFGKSR